MIGLATIILLIGILTPADPSESDVRPTPSVTWPVDVVPTLSAQETRRLREDFAAFHPALDREWTVYEARQLCSMILSGFLPRDVIVDEARRHFEHGDVELDERTPESIVTYIERSRWCQ